MSASQPTQEKTAATPAPHTSVTVGIDDLIVGRTLHLPIYDPKGVLLLAQGAVVTEERKRRLKDRGIDRILISEQDLANTTLGAVAETPEEAETAAPPTQASAGLDSELEHSAIPVRNHGPAMRLEVVRHGRAPYDSRQQAALKQTAGTTNRALDAIMQGVSQGGTLRDDVLPELVGPYLGFLKSDIDATVESTLIHGVDPSIAQHALAMSVLGMAMGVELGLDAGNVRTIGIAGLVADWGMMRVPKAIREARRPLTPIEFVEIQKHPAYTASMLDKVPTIPNLVRLVAYQIHERPDGSGYPRGRTGRNIHFFAQLLHVADAYVAMTSDRPYRPAVLPYEAVEWLLHLAQKRKVAPTAVRALLRVLSLFPIGSYVLLSDGRLGRVVRAGGDRFAEPIVEIVDEIDPETGEPAGGTLIDLSQSELTVVKPVAPPHGCDSQPSLDDW